MKRLSRSRLETFLRCQRQFQLRHIAQLPWPSPPEDGRLQVWQQHGELFHQFVAQYYLGAPAAALDETLLPEEVRGWWHSFLERPPVSRDGGQILVETTMTLPFREWQLIGRFDLLVVGDGVQIFDWKTGRPRPSAELERDWQTRLYLALIWGGHSALGVTDLPADRLSMTYWYPRQPDQSITVGFDEGQHRQNLAEIERIVGQIARQVAENEPLWPLTDDLAICARCSFRNYCGRFEAAALAARLTGWEEEERPEPELERLWEEELLLEPDESGGHGSG